MSGNYLQYLPVLAAAGVFLVLGLLCYVSSQHAFERSRKNISWIKRHGKGGYPFARNAFPNKPADWLGVFGVAVFALIAAMVSKALSAHEGGTNWLSGLFRTEALLAILIDVGAAVALYYLLQRLFGSTLVSACGALLYSASFVGAHTAASLLVIAFLLLVLWLNAGQERLFPAELLYYGALLVLAAALALRPALLPFALLFAGLHLYKHIFRLRRDEESGGDFALALVLAVIVWLLSAVSYAVVRTLVYFGFSMNTLSVRFGSEPLRRFAQILAGAFRASVQPLLRSRVLHPVMEAPLLGLGGFGLLSSIQLYRRRKDPRSVLALLFAGTAILVWILSDCAVLSAGLVLPAALLLSNFDRGGKRWPIAVMTALGVVYYLALLGIGYLLPFPEGILSRIA